MLANVYDKEESPTCENCESEFKYIWWENIHSIKFIFEVYISVSLSTLTQLYTHDR